MKKRLIFLIVIFSSFLIFSQDSGKKVFVEVDDIAYTIKILGSFNQTLAIINTAETNKLWLMNEVDKDVRNEIYNYFYYVLEEDILFVNEKNLSDITISINISFYGEVSQSIGYFNNPLINFKVEIIETKSKNLIADYCLSPSQNIFEQFNYYVSGYDVSFSVDIISDILRNYYIDDFKASV